MPPVDPLAAADPPQTLGVQLFSAHVRRDLPALGILILAYLVLALWFSAATPPLEAGDEMLQFYAVRQIATGRGLAVLDPRDSNRPDSPHQEAGQPPLYHVLAALAMRNLSTDDMLTLVPNPHAAIGIPTTETANRNRVVHPPDEDSLEGVLALRRARLVSIFFGAVALVATYLLARAVAPIDPSIAILAVALTAFNPMFLFVSASVANDSAIAALSALALLLLVPTVRGDLTPFRSLLQGLVIGLACLAKLSGVALVPLALGAILYGARGSSLWRLAWRHCALLLVGVAGVAGWWFVRNAILYDDPTAISAWLAVSGGRDRPFDLEELRGAWVGFWGVFGAFDILAQPWVYGVFAAICIAATVGWVGALISGGALPFERASVGLLAVWIAIEGVALGRWTTLTLASSGRLLFPAISAIAILISIGLLSTLRPARRRSVSIVGAAGLSTIAALIPPVSLAPAYQPAPRTSETELASFPIRPRTTFGDVLRLEGARVAPTTERRQPVEVELVWRSLKKTSQNYSVGVHLLGRDGARVGQLDVYPGAGRYPTSLWQPGELVRDALKVPVWSPVDSPTGARVAVAIYEFGTQNSLEARNPEGASVFPVVLGASELAPDPDVRCEDGVPDGVFGGRIRLVSVSSRPERIAPGDSLTVSLVWCLVSRPSVDYTAFVHLARADRTPVAQHDGPPRGGAYPSTAWARGELVPDLRSIPVPATVPPGAYRLVVGLYDPRDGSRLRTDSGRDAVDLGPVMILGSPARLFTD